MDNDLLYSAARIAERTCARSDGGCRECEKCAGCPGECHECRTGDLARGDYLFDRMREDGF